MLHKHWEESHLIQVLPWGSEVSSYRLRDECFCSPWCLGWSVFTDSHFSHIHLIPAFTYISVSAPVFESSGSWISRRSVHTRSELTSKYTGGRLQLDLKKIGWKAELQVTDVEREAFVVIIFGSLPFIEHVKYSSSYPPCCLRCLHGFCWIQAPSS